VDKRLERESEENHVLREELAALRDWKAIAKVAFARFQFWRDDLNK